MYLPNKYCGIGVPKVSDLTQKYKWNNLLGCQGLGHSPAQCINELLDHFPASKNPRATPIEVICPRHVTANSTTDLKMGARLIACSILEWTKESKIVIASRVFEDHQIVRYRIDNTNIIEKYERQAQLWPHKEIFSQDQVLRDVKFYVTDGSFKAKNTGAKDIITSEQTL
jgi:hypothetical protein